MSLAAKLEIANDAEAAKTPKKETTLCICCEHIPGLTNADATLVIKHVPPHALLAPISVICEKVNGIGEIFRWIREHIPTQTPAQIKVRCCTQCSTHPSLRLYPAFGRTFKDRCRDIENILPGIYRDLGTSIQCTAGMTENPPQEDGAVSGVRIIPSLKGGTIEYLDAPSLIDE